MRKPSAAELIVQALLLALIGVVIWDLVEAVGAVACQNVTELDAGGCYPWGWEGPLADFWYLRSREFYLVSRALDIFVFVLAFSMPFASGITFTSFRATIGWTYWRSGITRPSSAMKRKRFGSV